MSRFLRLREAAELLTLKCTVLLAGSNQRSNLTRILLSGDSHDVGDNGVDVLLSLLSRADLIDPHTAHPSDPSSSDRGRDHVVDNDVETDMTAEDNTSGEADSKKEESKSVGTDAKKEDDSESSLLLIGIVALASLVGLFTVGYFLNYISLKSGNRSVAEDVADEYLSEQSSSSSDWGKLQKEASWLDGCFGEKQPARPETPTPILH